VPTLSSISLAQARRTAVVAQGLGRARSGAVTSGPLQRVLDTVGVLQIDSVNVLSRSHYVPMFSRLGPYPHALLDRATNRAPRRLVEYWAHEASFVAPSTHRLLRFRMARAREEAWGGMVRAASDAPHLLADVTAVVTSAGPLTAAGIEAALERRGPRERTAWGWNWSETKRAVEFLFWAGRLSSAGRTASFERLYDLPERVLPPEVAAAPDVPAADACRELVALAARAHGVATEPDLRDYFRLRPEESKLAVTELVEEGVLVPVEVQGWSRPAYLHREARLPARVGGRALLSPFDSLVWSRGRAEALFDFRYRLEIYTPSHKRVHGYYVLPFLLRDRLLARVDLKADRPLGTLVVRAAWAEPGAAPGRAGSDEVVAELAAELRDLAAWLGLGAVVVEPRGDLAPALAAQKG
jgi:hypothetical protein